ncbi:MAG: hypothetical protein AAGD25_18735 [Cyanobacteria bacterium P01_F01_bin.150]
MKFNLFALTTLSCVCFLLTGLSPSHASQHKSLKGGSGHHHHHHETPSASDKPVTPASVDSSDASVEEHSEMDDAHAMPNHEGHGEGHSEAHGGHGSTHHGHGEHGDMMGGDPWFHHGSIEVSDVFHTSMAAHTENGAEVVSGESSIASTVAMPSLTVMVHPDSHRGWNVEIQTENFTFTPEQVNQANQPNVGHGHLYVNGEKVARVYGNWLHLDNLESGTNEITVSLHANGHEVWTHEGEAIAYTTTIEVP